MTDHIPDDLASFWKTNHTVHLGFYANVEMQHLIADIRDTVEDLTGHRLSNSNLMNLVLKMVQSLPVLEYAKQKDYIDKMVSEG